VDKYCRLAGLSILLFSTFSLAQDPSLPVVVAENAQRVMLRSAPLVRRSTALDSIARGDRLPLVDETDNWLQVRLFDGRTAWISRAYARISKLEDPVWVTAESPALHAGPAEDSATVAEAARGNLVQRLRQEGDWARIELADGSSGWIRATAIETALSASSPGVTAGEATSSGTVAAETAPAGEAKAITPPVEPEVDDRHASSPEGAEIDQANPVPQASPSSQSVTETQEPAAQEASPAATGLERPAPETSSLVSEMLPMAGVVVVLAVLGAGGFWWFRRRRYREIEQLIRAGQGLAGEMSGGAFLKSLREAEEKQARLEKDLQARLALLRKAVGSGETGEDSDEGVAVQRIEEVRRLVLDQQSKVNALSDLLALQSQKLAAAEEENQLLRRLLPRR
jgi:SH3-like domain-containing protein